MKPILLERFCSLKNNGQWESLHWYDRLHINWGKSDQGVTEYFLNRLGTQLQQTKGMEQVVVLHHAPVLPVKVEGDVLDVYLSAFSGSRRVWELIRRYKVKTVIHGHVHRKAIFNLQNMQIYSCYGEPCTTRIYK